MKINYNKITNSRKKGFTIIELMLVVSIILVLMGFLVPKFSAYQEKAKVTKAINTAKQIQTAAMASYGDNEGKFDKENVQSNIGLLTSVGNDVTVENPSSDDQSVDIKYKSDNKDCKVTVDAAQNSFVVIYDKKTVYPKAMSTNTQQSTKSGT
ncbi:type II secretion system protein [Clostridium sp. OS1-26]|uniref:type II secretion system protein n=1 Tax=Clostridium sp. OS1-26 TaxID=3070681 RepID=UPI0027DEAE21|nr:type II secretion system protein [Clostridium sp. OS1-26]WML37696.1 type II secretion system protein [Clostridium sp. OS1-26]